MFQSDKIRADNISRSFIPPSLMLCSEGRGGERAQAKGDGPARPPVKETNFFFFCVYKKERERERERRTGIFKIKIIKTNKTIKIILILNRCFQS